MAEESEAARGAVVITGASSGIGKAAAEELSRAGYRVFGTVRGPEDGVYLEEIGGQAVVLDVTDVAAVGRAAREVESALNGAPLRGLVNNAGIVILGPWELVAPERLRRLFEVNLLGAALVTQAFLPLLRAARGRIVMMSSLSRRFAAPYAGAYACSKVALEFLADSLRRELLHQGVDVVTIEPGQVRTPLWRKLREEHSAEDCEGTIYADVWQRVLRGLKVAGRGGVAAEEVARAVRRALAAEKAPRRIVVARRGWASRLINYLPGRLVDRLIARRL